MGSIKSIKHKRADELSNEASNFQCKCSFFAQRKKKKVQRYFRAITCFTFIVWKLPLWKAIARKEEKQQQQQQPAFLFHSDQIHINTEEKIPFSTTLSFWIIWKRNWEFKNEQRKKIQPMVFESFVSQRYYGIQFIAIQWKSLQQQNVQMLHKAREKKRNSALQNSTLKKASYKITAFSQKKPNLPAKSCAAHFSTPK